MKKSNPSGTETPILGEIDEYLIQEGTHKRLWDVLGAHLIEHQNEHGTHFSVWAPNARTVAVVGDFNAWDCQSNLLHKRDSSGLWETFVSGVGDGAAYMFAVTGADGVARRKADPFGFSAQHPPETASIVRDIGGYGWKDCD